MLRLMSAMAAALLLAAVQVQAGVTRTQDIQLAAGWNAVFLEVEPLDRDPEVVFNGLPVDQVLTYFPADSPVLFIQNPDEIPWQKQGWHRWVPAAAPEAFLVNLFAIQANQPYLIHATAAQAWQLEGQVKFRRPGWQPNSFNLAGAHVDHVSPPTFSQYLAGSNAHSDLYIYRLENNIWTKVTSPAATSMTSGAAYWLYCRGGSNFMGGLEVELPNNGDGLDFPAADPDLEITVTNRSPDPLSFIILHLANEGGDPEVPLLLETRPQVGDPPVYVGVDASYNLEPSEFLTIKLVVKLSEISVAEVSGLLKIADDRGNLFHIPVRAAGLPQ